MRVRYEERSAMLAWVASKAQKLANITNLSRKGWGQSGREQQTAYNLASTRLLSLAGQSDIQ